MVYRTVYNPGDAPVSLNTETGETLGGGEWGTAETTAPGVSEALDAGRLVEVDGAPADDQSHEGRAALEQTERWGKRQAKISKLSKEDLVDWSREKGLIAEDEEPNRDVLEAIIVKSRSEDLPSARKRSTASTADKND